MTNDSTNTENKCLFCGHVIPPRATKRGKEPFYHKECKDARNFLDALSRSLNAIDCMTPEKMKMLRGDLFALTNTGLPKKIPLRPSD